MNVERYPGSLSALEDDALGTIAVSLVVSEVKWTPDVAPAVLDRIARDAVTYPDQFDRRPLPPTLPLESGTGARSSRRIIGRLAVFAGLLALLAIAVAIAANSSAARGATPDLAAIDLELIPIADGFRDPVFVTNAGDDDLYVVEQRGLIRRIDATGVVDPEPFLDLREVVAAGGERGLLGLAFHPDYPEDPRLFLDYTRRPDGATVVSEVTVTDGIADPASERVLLAIDQPAGNHNGGMIAFDASGALLIGMGDGGGGRARLPNGQNPDSLLGKLLRIDVDGAEPYAIPPDNGYAATDAHRPEIHAKGLRNPWRFSVDPVGGHIYIGDVGESRWEEVDVLPFGGGGANLGWGDVDGPECFVRGCDLAAYDAPTLSYDHSEGCSIVGGNVYRGAQQAGLNGIYLFGDTCSGRIWGADAAQMLEGTANTRELVRMAGTLVAFGVDGDGEVYAVDYGGSILHIRSVAAA